ncbi:MAG: DUF4263 domain-containing protein [Henriciella sp.]|nr:DUF4263 domain-containing protein [Henriciella sp.]
MSDEQEHDFFKLRKEGKTYLTKVFASQFGLKERVRFVKMVMNNTDSVMVGELEGALCLRVDGNVRKTQVAALVSQDDKSVRRLSLQTFMTRDNKAMGSHFATTEKHEFSFRRGEFEKLLSFLKALDFIDLSNEERFQIEDISSQSGPKTLIDASDKSLLQRLKGMQGEDREKLFNSLSGSLSNEEINILLGRKSGLNEFENQMMLRQWSETQWQDFFERQQWVFGYGLDYRIVRHFSREASVGGSGSDNRNRPIVDFLMNFKEYSVLVEIKRPNTPIFKNSKSGRAGTWEFSSEFISAVSQVLEQQAEWQIASASGEHFNKEGNQRLQARTRKPKTILVIGSKHEFSVNCSERDNETKLDTFELFRRECGSIDIITYDELLDRAKYIARNEQ